MLMTISDFAVKKGVAVQTVYSWIRRKRADKNGFKVVPVGSVLLIEPTTVAKQRRNTGKQP